MSPATSISHTDCSDTSASAQGAAAHKDDDNVDAPLWGAGSNGRRDSGGEDKSSGGMPMSPMSPVTPFIEGLPIADVGHVASSASFDGGLDAGPAPSTPKQAAAADAVGHLSSSASVASSAPSTAAANASDAKHTATATAAATAARSGALAAADAVEDDASTARYEQVLELLAGNDEMLG